MSHSIDDLRLSFTYSRPRGQEGVSCLRVEAIATGLRFTFIPDLTMPGSSGEKTGDFGRNEWRDIVAAIEGDKMYALHTSGTEGEYPWPWTMNFEGARNFASEQLVALRIQVGSFFDETFVRRVVALQARLSEVGVPLNEFVHRHGGSELDLSAIDRALAQAEPEQPPPSAMRQSFAIAIGLALAIGGSWFTYFFLVKAVRVPPLLLAGAGFMAIAGFYMIWETITGSRKR